MAYPTGEAIEGFLRLDCDRRLKLEFHGSRITSDAGLLAYRELDDALGLSVIGGDLLADTRTGSNGRHALVGFSGPDPDRGKMDQCKIVRGQVVGAGRDPGSGLSRARSASVVP